MTDSTTNTNAGDGALDVGATTDDLFGEFDDESFDRESVDGGAADDGNTSAESTSASAATGGVEDQTAAAVFGQLQNTVSDTDDVDDVLENESPEDIIASADEPDPEPESDPVDDLLVDEAALEDLLLTGRTKEQEFLWIDAEGDDGASEPSETDASSDPASVFTDSDADAGEDETEPRSESAAGSAHVPFQEGSEEAASSDESHGSDDQEAATLEEADDRDAATTETEAEPAGDGTAEAPPTSELEGETGTDAETVDATDPDPEHTETTDATDPDPEQAETEETALVADENTGVPATTEDDESAGGLFGWLRSKLGGLF
ncbi:hypothetical protein GS429_01270 [Natronorubrum sp. JWXQ-INN-674]|uniref:Uncharacterized protein n=1 Tax=Natronorubrum halalkaliphilum TaxID=2691917 RepID=A0A6B0VG18_9EURY|nr:hypothetical protein [Natronorubrum halalkaliphilum]MXV60721.1 hypothetical protein [Natronorubrum halalkaliphilum]